MSKYKDDFSKIDLEPNAEAAIESVAIIIDHMEIPRDEAKLTNEVGEEHLRAKFDEAADRDDSKFYQRNNAYQNRKQKHEAELKDTRCPKCSSDHIVAEVAKRPHTYKWTCGKCGAYIKFTSNPTLEIMTDEQIVSSTRGVSTMSKKKSKKQITEDLTKIDKREKDGLGSKGVVYTRSFTQRQKFGAASEVTNINPKDMSSE